MTDTSKEQHLVEKLAGRLQAKTTNAAGIWYETGKDIELREETYEEWVQRKEQE